MAALTAEPTYVISLLEVVWGGTLVAITMAIHGCGMLAVLRTNGALKHCFASHPSLFTSLFRIVFASWMILVVHLFEIFWWALFFFWQSAFPNASTCYYFALNEYTTLGSSFHLPFHWRLLEGMLAMTGLMTFAWSTGVLLTLAQDFEHHRLQAPQQPR